MTDHTTTILDALHSRHNFMVELIDKLETYLKRLPNDEEARERLAQWQRELAEIDAAIASVQAAGVGADVADGPLDTLGTILRNRTIFIPCSLARHVLHGYTMPDDVRLVRAEQPAPTPVSVPQPEWANAPDWAMWRTVDCDGQVRWSHTEPVIDHSGFWDVLVLDGFYVPQVLGDVIDIPLGVDWRTLKQMRPTPARDYSVEKKRYKAAWYGGYRFTPAGGSKEFGVPPEIIQIWWNEFKAADESRRKRPAGGQEVI